MLDGILGLSFWGYVVATLLVTHVTIVAVTVFLHRCQAHRALELHPAVSHFFRFWLWLTTGMGTRGWVAVHRKHHAKCETEEDPHSPQILGVRKVLLEGAELYVEEAENQETLSRYGQGTPDDWLEQNVYQRHSNLGVTVLFFVNLLLFGLAGIAIWAIQMLWIPLWAAGVINGIGHYWGYRNYECPDASCNIVPWAILIGGEELHNNHHAYPNSAKLSSRGWEFDIGWLYIKLLQMMRLAKVRHVARLPRVDTSKEYVDLDTLRAIIVNRLEVMARFARTVTLPVLKQEAKQADASLRRVLKRARSALVKGKTSVDEQSQQYLQAALNRSETLRIVYDYRERLLQIWSRTAAGQEQMMRALQDWCTQAEASGISVLQEFARTLRSYSIRPA